MKKIFRQSFSAFVLFSLSSCALPPREAWRVIQNDGLFPYVAVEMGRKPVPKYVRMQQLASSRFVTLTDCGKSPHCRAAGNVYVARPSCCLQTGRYLNSGLFAPPVLVSTKPAAHCPAPAPAPRRPVVAVAPKPAPPQPAPTAIAPRPAPSAPVVKQMTSEEKEIADAPKAMPAPTDAAENQKAAPKPSAPPNKPVANGTATVKPAGMDLPFGTPVPGRPGLVTSPFAGQYQLVDVTGLNPGQEVKCPYSGKVFLVPGVQQAANSTKPPTAPPPPPAPEKKQ